MSGHAGLLPLGPPRFAFERLMTRRLLAFVQTSGIAPPLARLGVFTADQALQALGAALGFTLGDPTRARMVRVLLDFLADCGYLDSAPGGSFAWRGPARVSALAAGDASAPAASGGADRGDGCASCRQVDFFEQCLAYAPQYLRGGPPLFDFDAGSADAWEQLLGNDDFAFARALLARTVLPRDERPCHALVLCYGPGYDLVEIERRRPHAMVTAIDFTDSFRARASGRLRHPERVRWVGSATWGGFGAPLPFPSDTFDVVLFSCADPYVPADLCDAVYGDIRRTVRPEGVLGVLTRSYPDLERRDVQDEWVRRGTFCHDFLESVCKGWQGFRSAAGSRRLFQDVGFTIDVVTLGGSVWRLVKGGAGTSPPPEARGV